MKFPPKIRNEEARLEALHELQILDTPAEERFDRITKLVSSVFEAPIALVSLVDKNRQWFKSSFGVNFQQTSRDESFCAHAIANQSLMVVEDAWQDERFFDNPLVTKSLKVRFYAGVPLLYKNHAIGTLCIMDKVQRAFDESNQKMLMDFAKLVEDEISSGNTYAQNQKYQAIQQLNKAITIAQSKFINESNKENVFEGLLDEVLSMTKTELGVIGEVFYNQDNQPYLQTRALSNHSSDPGLALFFRKNIIDGLEFRNTESLLGQVLQSKKPIICDPYQATPGIKQPPGHPVLLNFLGIPVFYGDDLVAEIILANRAQGFDQDLVTFLEPLLLTLGQLIRFNRIKQQQLEIQKELAQFKHSVDRALDCVFMFDADSFRFFYVNKGACKQVGYSQSEMLKMHPYDIKPKFSVSEFKAFMQGIIQSEEKSTTFQTVHQHKSGEWIDVEIFLQYFSAEGASPYFIAFVRDITKTKNLIKELQLGDQIFNNAHDCIMVADGVCQGSCRLVSKSTQPDFLYQG